MLRRQPDNLEEKGYNLQMKAEGPTGSGGKGMAASEERVEAQRIKK